MTGRKSIYLASSFDLTDRVQSVFERLVNAGHSIPDVWWHKDFKELNCPDDAWYEAEQVKAVFERHKESILKCDTFVLVCPESGSKKYNGANWECGFAAAHGLDSYALGDLERSAMYAGLTRVDTVDDLLDELGVPYHVE